MQAFSSRINIPLLHEPRNDTETVGFPCKTYRFYCSKKTTGSAGGSKKL